MKKITQKNKIKIRVFETFSGIGAQHKALDILESLGYLEYKIVATSEWDIWANISYNAIHNKGMNIASKLTDEKINSFLLKFTHSSDSKTPLTQNQVLKLSRNVRENLYSSLILSNNLGSISEIKGKNLFEQAGVVDLLTYSFPCQDLSTAGSFHGKNQGMKKNSGTRSGLLWEIERILNELKQINELPKYLLLENVNNMLSERHKKEYIKWISFLKKIGYNTQTYVLEANNYGCPQNRKRVFALSVRKDISKSFKDTYFESNKQKIKEFNAPLDISKEVNINLKLDSIIKNNYNIEKYRNEAIKATPNDTPSRRRMYSNNRLLSFEKDPTEQKHLKAKYYKKGELKYSQFTSTITTKQDRDPNSGSIDLKGTILENMYNETKCIDKSNYRFLTPRECFLLMGFKENDYESIIKNTKNIVNNKGKKIISETILYRQAGNSISVNVLVSIFNKILEIEKSR
ncbi:DNA (cytosine-5-)-methyltransferase [Mesoplasma florum]|nr:DNA (cytosine-5-)-methyltransferase [Mesoplasma florum]